MLYPKSAPGTPKLREEIANGDVVYVTTIYCVIDLFAVQFAKAAGAIVYATASTRSLPHVRALGVDEVIDYRQQKIELLAGDIDLVVETL